MRYALAVVLLAAVAALIFWAMSRGQKRVIRESADIGVPPQIPAGEDGQGPFHATYISTVRGTDWLARVGAHNLGDRSTAEVTLRQTGISIRATQLAMHIPFGAMEAIRMTRGQAGKFSLGDARIMAITWMLDGTQVTTALHFPHNKDFNPNLVLMDAAQQSGVPVQDSPVQDSPVQANQDNLSQDSPSQDNISQDHHNRGEAAGQSDAVPAPPTSLGAAPRKDNS